MGKRASFLVWLSLEETPSLKNPETRTESTVGLLGRGARNMGTKGEHHAVTNGIRHGVQKGGRGVVSKNKIGPSNKGSVSFCSPKPPKTSLPKLTGQKKFELFIYH